MMEEPQQQQGLSSPPSPSPSSWNESIGPLESVAVVPSTSTLTSTTNQSSLNNSNNPLLRKLQKVLSTRLDGHGNVLESLAILSEFYGDNTLHARRNLRGDIERRSLLINEDFLGAFDAVNALLEEACDEVHEVRKCCLNLQDRLRVAGAQMTALVDETRILQQEGETLRKQQVLSTAFNEHFKLSDRDIEALCGGSTSLGRGSPAITDDFFTALKRVRSIHADCKVLLRTSQQHAGLAIMEAMAMRLEAAFERLYRWTQSRCHSLTSDCPEPSKALRMAFEALVERPVLHRYCLDEAKNARKTAVVRGFLDTLTIGHSSGGYLRPIELHSHDPVRYVGDMMAWLHQSIASERDLFENLLELHSIPKNHLISNSVTSSAADNFKPTIDPSLKAILDGVMEGCVRPLSTRLTQVLQSVATAFSLPEFDDQNSDTNHSEGKDNHSSSNGGMVSALGLGGGDGIVTFHRLSSLLSFYGTTFLSILPSDSALLNLILETRQRAHDSFLGVLRRHGSGIVALAASDGPPPDLGPTPTVSQAMGMLREILSSYESALVDSDARRQEEELDLVILLIIDPVFDACHIALSAVSPPLGSALFAVFLANCLYSVQTVLALYDSTTKHVKRLDGLIQEQIEVATEAQIAHVLDVSGLASLLRTIDEYTQAGSSTDVLARFPGMRPSEIQNQIAGLDNILISADTSVTSLVSSLLSSQLRNAVQISTKTAIADAYQQLYDVIMSPKSCYDDPSSIVHRTPEQVRLIL